MTLLTIIQARTGSTRLPGKVLETVGDHTILEWVIHRLEQASHTGRIVVATTPKTADDPIATLCGDIGYDCYRSSEHDVLNRYYQAAIHYQADTIIRVTADCPLLCPALIDQIVAAHIGYPGLDYITVEGAPAGFAQELVTFQALEQAWRHATHPADREHVITYTTAHPNKHPAMYLRAEDWMFDRRHWRFTIDEPDDLELIRALHDETDGQLADMPSKEILDVVADNAPMLALATRQP